MKKALPLAAVVALAALAIAWFPRQPAVAAAPELDRAALDAQIDARLHNLLGRLIAQSREGADAQLAVR